MPDEPVLPAGEREQQPELGGREVDLAVVADDAVRDGLDPQPVELERRVLVAAPADRRERRRAAVIRAMSSGKLIGLVR